MLCKTSAISFPCTIEGVVAVADAELDVRMHHTVSASDCLESSSGESGVEAIYADESIWLSQKMMGELYNVNVRTVSEHLRNIFNDSELEEEEVIRNFRITATDGKNYNTKHYNLKAIIAVGYKVNSERAVQFRKWATDIVSEYTSKAMFYGAKKRYHLALFSQGSLLKTLLLKA